jgi:hypothetical protein
MRRRIRTKPLARQQTVELIGGKKLPVRSRDRHHKTIHRMLAGQDHRNDRAVTEIHGAAVVFYSFDDECHLAHDHRWHAPIARPATQSRIGENDIADKPAIDPIEPQPYPYWGKQQTGPASRAVRHGYIEAGLWASDRTSVEAGTGHGWYD